MTDLEKELEYQRAELRRVCLELHPMPRPWPRNHPLVYYARCLAESIQGIEKIVKERKNES